MTTMKNPEVAPEQMRLAIERAVDVITLTEHALLELAKKVKGAPNPPYEFDIV